MKRKRNWAVYALGVIGACALLSIAVFVLSFIARRAAPTRPLVEISGTFPQSPATARQPVVVFAEASDPEGIASVELWINGSRVAEQSNPDPDSGLPFASESSWIPNGAGDYLITVKAVDLRRTVGESDPLLVTVAERSYEPDPQARGSYVTVEGDTWESIAERLGITPDELRSLNPDVSDLSPGTNLTVPDGVETAGPPPEGSDIPPDAAGIGAPTGGSFPAADVPAVDPPAPPESPPPGAATEADPAPVPFWRFLPVDIEIIICLLDPTRCAPSAEHAAPAAPLHAYAFVREDGCTVRVTWADNSDDEVGFRVYRIRAAEPDRPELVALVDAFEGTSATLFADDTQAPGGTVRYYVAAYNAGGATQSAPSGPIETRPCSPVVGISGVLEVEGLSLTVGEGFDRLYCYASLAGSPFERIPAGTEEFITLEAGTWNIAQHFSGENKRRVLVGEGGPLTIVVECLGWQGAELVNLGRFERAHPPQEWDGRTLEATPAGSGFSATYRINRSGASDEEVHTGSFPIIDPSIPPPYFLHQTPGFRDCNWVESIEGFDCVNYVGPSLRWAYDVEALPPETPLRFKVYIRFDTANPPVNYYTTTTPRQSYARQQRVRCYTDVYYSVSAVVGTDPATGQVIESPPSEELLIPASCAVLEVELLNVRVEQFWDGDPCHLYSCSNYQNHEAYGWIRINSRTIQWGQHCHPQPFGGCLVPWYDHQVVGTIGLQGGWMVLNTGSGFRQENNVWRVAIGDGDDLSLRFEFWDHDSPDDDDLWCGQDPYSRGSVQLAEGRSMVEWLAFDQEIWVGEDGVGGDVGACDIRFHVRGLPAGG